MSKKDHTPRSRTTSEGSPLNKAMADEACCVPDGEGHCITCSDEALKVRVVAVDAGSGMARVAVTPAHIEEVDISLLEQVGPGDLVLVHAGVALERCISADEEDSHV